MKSTYLDSIRKQFQYYKMIAEQAMTQVPDAALFEQFNSECNSIAMIIQHLHGNMMSRWTDFLTTDGEKEWRERDAEFEAIVLTRQDLMKIWEQGWNCLFAAMDMDMLCGATR